MVEPTVINPPINPPIPPAPITPEAQPIPVPTPPVAPVYVPPTIPTISTTPVVPAQPNVIPVPPVYVPPTTPTEPIAQPSSPITTPVPPAYIPPAPPSSGIDKKYFIIGGAILGVLLIIGVATRVIALMNTVGKGNLLGNKSGSEIVGQASLINAYSKDSDSDQIPDAVETAISLDPNVSEFDRCAVQSCNTSDKANATKPKSNIMIVLDSSGSMKQSMSSGTKMDQAKDAIRRFIASADSNISFGLTVYGQKGSNAESDKAISCASSEIIAPLGSVSSSNVDTYLNVIQPTGWTPIGLAIKQSMSAFVGKEGQQNQIIIVTDGGETCNSNPETAATSAQNSSSKIQVNVIGFAVNPSEYDALKKISTNGGGLFSVALNADGLLDKFKASHENFKNYMSDAKCIIAEHQKSSDCFFQTKQLLSKYLSDLSINKKGNESKFFSDLYLKLPKIYGDKSDEVSAEGRKQIQDQQKALGIN